MEISMESKTKIDKADGSGTYQPAGLAFHQKPLGPHSWLGTDEKRHNTSCATLRHPGRSNLRHISHIFSRCIALVIMWRKMSLLVPLMHGSPTYFSKSLQIVIFLRSRMISVKLKMI
jgi:hypothetical protein